MNELITGLNGGNVPALDIIMLLTFAALLPSIVVMICLLYTSPSQRD